MITTAKLRGMRNVLLPILSSEKAFMSLTDTTFNTLIAVNLIGWALKYPDVVKSSPFGHLAELFHKEIVLKSKLTSQSHNLYPIDFEEGIKRLDDYEVYVKYSRYFFDEQFEKQVITVFNEFYDTSITTFGELGVLALANKEKYNQIMVFLFRILESLIEIHEDQEITLMNLRVLKNSDT